METVTDLPHKTRVVEHTWIPLRDGTRLAARMWIPEGAEDDPVPAILEYIPYRKRDFTRKRDERTHPYFAGHGYAALRVDLRGSGDSEGVLTDEYLPSELDDGEDVLAWIAEQPWCDGSVGMIGISWGGFNGLQLAARRPRALKAIVTCSSTDDRYADDVHYMGGCLLGDNLSWASTMFAYNALPPDPALVGDRWRAMWHQRLEGSGLWLETWLRHQHRDAYWRHGSVCEDYAAIDCPVLAVSGWADGYSNAVFRLLENLDVPRAGLIGPWSHVYPHLGTPGPAIGFLQEVVRWFDRWLKGIENGIDDEPMLRAWMQDAVRPVATYDHRPGRWVAESVWPTPRIVTRRHPLTRGRILEPRESPGALEPRAIQSPLSLGLFAGKWCSYAAAPDLPHDQREEDGGALVFDTEPLPQRLEILGRAVADLVLVPDQPVAMIAVRLIDVAPDGKATRITYGLLNLCHRDGHEAPRPLEPGVPVRVAVKLNDVAQAVPKGHRIRLALSTSYWPLAWPPPRPVTLQVHPEESALLLPERPAVQLDDEVEFGPPMGTSPLETETVETGEHNWLVTRDLAADRSQLEVIEDQGAWRIRAHGLEVRRKTYEWYRSTADDFTSVEGEVLTTRALSRGPWSAETVARTHLSCDEENFLVHATLDAYESGRRVFAETWDLVIPRELV
ncbi:CocE/NonD family hydrolase [Egibacter rhizosphaerae]|uniref:CocE/NonD family hydrolase n=1 Tax=Egibacter rhizosphaerae TaxID=1670831 RepID=A0A411YAC0_9ACTN|nr:CocE/NonD family hydrolase [Egibacter rhizosphaerae]QBI18151.1 CocE/NonD family hydrolase [Egibacter rhizosphaerae]